MSSGTYSSDFEIDGSLSGIWRYRDLLKNLVVRDIKVRYKRSFLGFAWMLINPLVMMVVLWVVFHDLFRTGDQNYALYLISGLLFFNFFATGSASGLASVVNAGGLIRKVAVPKVVFPLAAVVANLVNLLFSLIPLFAILLIARMPIGAALVVIPVAILAGFLFTFGVALLLATLNVFYRDVRWFYDSAIQVLQWATPIIYPAAILPARYRGLVTYNPLAHLVDAFRSPIMTGEIPAASHIALVLAIGGATAAVGFAVFRRYQDRFINFL